MEEEEEEGEGTGDEPLPDGGLKLLAGAMGLPVPGLRAGAEPQPPGGSARGSAGPTPREAASSWGRPWLEASD